MWIKGSELVEGNVMLAQLISGPLDSPATEARNLLQQTVVDENNRIQLPIDLEKIAEKLQVSVKSAPLDPNIAGFIVQRDQQTPVEMTLNSSDSAVRQRFTCAHEIGHFIKRTKSSQDLIGFVDYRNEVSSRGTDPEEIWANGFAAELIMPSFAVRQFWADGHSSSSLSSLFGVSQRAMDVRLSALGIS